MSHSLKKLPLIVLVITAFIFSRLSFTFINDPEGPNLLIVTVLAAFFCALSFPVYFYKLHTTSQHTKLALAILIQILLTISCILFFIN